MLNQKRCLTGTSFIKWLIPLYRFLCFVDFCFPSQCAFGSLDQKHYWHGWISRLFRGGAVTALKYVSVSRSCIGCLFPEYLQPPMFPGQPEPHNERHVALLDHWRHPKASPEGTSGTYQVFRTCSLNWRMDLQAGHKDFFTYNLAWKSWVARIVIPSLPFPPVLSLLSSSSLPLLEFTSWRQLLTRAKYVNAADDMTIEIQDAPKGRVFATLGLVCTCFQWGDSPHPPPRNRLFFFFLLNWSRVTNSVTLASGIPHTDLPGLYSLWVQVPPITMQYHRLYFLTLTFHSHELLIPRLEVGRYFHVLIHSPSLQKSL